MFSKNNKDVRIIKTIKEVMPAVVSVVASKKFDELEKDLDDIKKVYPDFSIDDIPKDNIDADGNIEIGGGSGFIVDENGTILTNKHVVADGSAKYSVVLSDGDSFKAEVVAMDPIDDIAILNVDAKPRTLPTVHMGSSEGLELGQTTLAFGNVLGLFQDTVSKGIVSGLSRSITARITPQSPSFEMRGLVQTDAAINPGNSGGPLTDVEGKVVGVNVAVASGVQNVGFAIPIERVKRDLQELNRFGEIRRPFLGVRYITLNKNISKKLDLEIDYGALVVRGGANKKAVVEGSPAEEVDIREGDIIIRWNGSKITEKKNIHDFLEKAEVGDKVDLKILREREKINIPVQLKKRD